MSLLKNCDTTAELIFREHSPPSFSNQRSTVLPFCVSNSDFVSSLYVCAAVSTVCYVPHDEEQAGMQYGVPHNNDDILISKEAYI